MSDFITRLAQRQLGQLVTVEPKLPSRFAASAPTAPMPVIEDVPEGVSDSPRSTNLQRPLDRVPSGGVVLRNEGSAAGAVEPTIVHLPRQPREASHNAQHSAREASTNEPTATRQNPEPLTAESRPSIERRVTGPESIENFALPIVTEAIAAATPRREPETSPDQNHVERGARPPLVETRAAIPSSAPPRLEVTTWNRSEIRGREGAAAAAEPPIHVTIGRIEVTSLTQAALAKRPGAPRKPALSLDDYLARRQGRQP